MKNKKIEVSVKKKDIKNGTPGDPNSCAIALAAQRKFKTDDVAVLENTMEVEDRVFVLPKRAQNFIIKFDDELPVEPFSFKVEEA